MAGRRIDIDEKIERAQAEVTKAKKKYDAAVEELEKLMTKKRDAAEGTASGICEQQQEL